MEKPSPFEMFQNLICLCIELDTLMDGKKVDRETAAVLNAIRKVLREIDEYGDSED